MKTLSLTSIATVIVLSGCSSTPPTKLEIARDQIEVEAIKAEVAQDKAEMVVDNIPPWALEPPQSDGSGIYAVGIGESRSVNTAIKKSKLNAQFELAKAFGSEISGNEQSYTKENSHSGTTQFTQLIDSIVDTVPMNGFETLNHEMVTLEGKYTSYRLIKLSYEQFDKALKLANKEETQTEIKESFIELQQRLEQRKKGKPQQL